MQDLSLRFFCSSRSPFGVVSIARTLPLCAVVTAFATLTIAPLPVYAQQQNPKAPKVSTPVLGSDTASLLRINMPGHTAKVNGVLFTPDGELISVGNDKTLRIWNVAGGEQKEVRRFQVGIGEKGMLLGVALSSIKQGMNASAPLIAVVQKADPGRGAPDHKGAPATDDLLLIDRKSGAVRTVSTGLEVLSGAVAFSPDGTRVALSGYRNQRFCQVRVFEIARRDAKTQVLTALQQPRLVREFPKRTVEDWVSDDTVDNAARLTIMDCLVFSPDGSRIATGNRNGTVRIFDADSGKVVRERDFAARRPVRAIDWATDGRGRDDAIVVGVEDQVYVWNQAPDRNTIEKEAAGNQVTALRFAPGATPDSPLRVMIGVGANRDGLRYPVLVWTRAESAGAAIRPVEVAAHNNPVSAIAVSPDGTTVASADAEGRIVLTNLETHVARSLAARSLSLRQVRWRLDNDAIAWNGPARSGDAVRSGYEFSSATLLPNGIENDALAPTGDSIGFVSKIIHNQGAARVVLTNAPAREEDAEGLTEGERAASRVDVFDFDNHRLCSIGLKEGENALCAALASRKTVVVGTQFGIYLYDISQDSQKPVRRFKGFEGVPVDVAVSPNGKYVAAAAGDGTIRIFPVTEGEPSPLKTEIVTSVAMDVKKSTGDGSVTPLLSFFPTQDGEWIAWNDATGVYTASTNGDSYIGWQDVTSGEFRLADQMRSEKLRSEVIAQVLESGDITRAATVAKKAVHPISEALGNLPRVRVAAVPGAVVQKDGSYLVRSQSATINVDAVRADGSLISNDTVKFEQQSDLAEDRGRKLVKRTDAGQIVVSGLKPGPNIVSIFARVTGAGESRPVKVTINYASGADSVPRAKRQKPNLYVLSIGVKEFPNAPQLNLNYPDRDATEIAEVFQQQEGPLFEHVERNLLLNGAAKRENIRTALTKAAAYVNSHNFQDNPDDLVVVFVSTHGFRDKGTDANGAPRYDFYLAPSDLTLTPGQPTSQTCLPLQEVSDALAGMRASNVVLLLDQCHAGGIAEAVKVTAENDAFRRIRERNFVTIAASAADQPSVEDSEWKHGAFTYALLKALRGEFAEARAASNNGDYVLRLGIANFFLTGEVDRLVREKKGAGQRVSRYSPPGMDGELIPLAAIPGPGKGFGE